MKFLTSTVFAAIAAGTTVSPLTVERRAAPQDLQVRSLSGGCLRHGTGCSISFQIKTDLQTAWTTCNQYFPNAANEIPEQPFTETGCSDPAVIWSYRIIGKGPRTFNAVNYTLIVAFTTQGLAAAKIWPAEQWPVINDGSSFHQVYAGPDSFLMK